MASKTNAKPRDGSNGTLADVLTLEEAADLLRVTADVLKKEIEAGRVPAKFLAGAWRLSRNGILDWLSHRETGAFQKTSKERFLELSGLWAGEPESEQLADRLAERLDQQERKVRA